MVKYMLAYDGIAEPEYDNTHANRIRLLKQNDLLPYEVKNTLYILRKDRNNAAHNAADEGARALSNLELLYNLCVWVMHTYGDYNYVPESYVTPVDVVVSLEDLEQENKELEARNKQLLIELQTIQQQGKADSNRRAVAYSKALALKLTEAQTRELIDDQLRKCGWEADTNEIRYSKGTRPTKGKNVEYVINCLGKNTTKVRNIKSYLLASLFNAGSTTSSYYRAEVNHDMPQYAG